MALASGMSRPLLGRLPSTARPHLAVSSSIRFFGTGSRASRAVSLCASAPPAVIRTDGFDYLKDNCPSLQSEILRTVAGCEESCSRC